MTHLPAFGMVLGIVLLLQDSGMAHIWPPSTGTATRGRNRTLGVCTAFGGSRWRLLAVRGIERSSVSRHIKPSGHKQ